MIRKAQDALLRWYERHGRHELPWRNTSDVYHIYVSEIMLQQTQVKRVMEEYYPGFLAKFPTLQTLADAKEEDVLAAWSGLGYYSRARNLHKTAKLCPDTLPKTEQELLKLPGIGRYTASAIRSFGYHQKTGVVDTNISRVIKRFFAHYEQGENLIWQSAEEFVNPDQPTLHNQALMDLGSLICLPSAPKCDECPLVSACQGKEEPDLYTQKQKKVYEELELFYGVAFEGENIALKLSSGPMYKGMLELPSVEPIEEDFIAEFRHSYTKYRLRVKLFRCHEVPSDTFLVDFNGLENRNISSLTKKALLQIEKVMR